MCVHLIWVLLLAALDCGSITTCDGARGGEFVIVGSSPSRTVASGHHGGSAWLLACALGAVAPALVRRRQRVIIYARYSTDKQSPRSIDDQVAKCQQFVDRLGLADVEMTVLHDAAVSGEHCHRPGIDGVWELIESGGCDVIVAEDLSRLYRHSTRAMQLIEAAVDAGIRVVAINSHLDTAEDEGRWRMGGLFASMKAELDNTETRQRIMRAMDGLWRQGYA